MSNAYNAVQHGQYEQQNKERRNRTDRLKESIEKCSHALERGDRRHYHYIATRLAETIIPTIREHTPKSLDEFDTDLDGREDWDWVALSRFLANSDAIISTLESGSRGRSSDHLTLQSSGYVDETTTARETVRRALHSVACIAEQIGIVKGKYTKTAEAVGLSGRTIGRVYKDPKMPFGDEVEAIVDVGTIKSAFIGGTNTGKSTAGEGQYQDYYWRNFVDGGEPTKCIDPVDMSVGENIFYDVPQQDEDLRKAREDMDLEPDFTETDLDPEQEILIPLSPSLNDGRMKLPYDTEADEYVPDPFVVPAADISQDLFVAVLTARVSNTEEDTLREVYETVDRERGDWSLKHLAEEVASRDELSDKHQRKAIRVIRSLQDMGFIRQRGEYELDWDQIFRSTDVVTSINQLVCRNDRERLFVLAWILEQMWERRNQTVHYPQMAMMLRELWSYAPQRNMEHDDDIAAALQGRIIYLLTRFLRQNRDVRTHVVGDSQNIADVNRGVREEFNRFCLFEASFSPAEKFFEWTGNQSVESFVSNITTDVGECGIVGAIGPAYEHSRVEYLAPVAMAPPSHHHHDKDDGNGFLVRCDLVDREEPRSPATDDDIAWPIEVPEGLQIPTPDELLEDADGEDGGDGGSSEPSIEEMHRREAREMRRNGKSLRDIASAIPNNPDTGRPYYASTISTWTEDIDPNDNTTAGNANASAD